MDTQTVVDNLRQLPREGLVRVLYDTVPWKKRDDYKTKIMDPAVKPLRPDMVLIGPAFTVADPWMSLDMLADESKKDCVLTIASSGFDGTFAGGFMGTLAQSDGAVGMLTDGYVTGSAALTRRDFPVFSRGTRIPHVGYSFEGRFQVPISCGGVIVNPGDIIVGDSDGVMVLTVDEADWLCENSKWLFQIMDVLTQRYLRKGVRFVDIPGVRDYWRFKVEGTRDEAEFYQEWLAEHGAEDQA